MGVNTTTLLEVSVFIFLISQIIIIMMMMMMMMMMMIKRICQLYLSKFIISEKRWLQLFLLY